MRVKMSKAFELQSLCEKLGEEILPLRVSYKIAKAQIVITEEINFFKKQYANYLNLFAQKDENGEYITTASGGIKIIEGSEKECANKFKELEDLEFDLPNFEFTLDELEGLNLSLADVSILTPFITE